MKKKGEIRGDSDRREGKNKASIDGGGRRSPLPAAGQEHENRRSGSEGARKAVHKEERRDARQDARKNARKGLHKGVRRGCRNGYGDHVEEIYDISSPQNLDEICSSHYFTSDSALEDELRYFDYVVAGKTLHITSNSGVFSKNHVDRGSELLIRTVLAELAETAPASMGERRRTDETEDASRSRAERAGEMAHASVGAEKAKVQGGHEEACVSAGALRIADLGTGYGIILLSLLSGLAGSRGTGFEVSNRALRLARINAKKNKLRDRADFVSGDLRLHSENLRLHAECLRQSTIDSDREDDTGRTERGEPCPRFFDLIVTNPPIRAGKDVVYAFFDFAKASLSDRGVFYAVISKNQGANSARKYLETLFGNAEIAKREGEFRIIKCVQSAAGKANAGDAATGKKAAAGAIAAGDTAEEHPSAEHAPTENTSELGQNID